MHARTPSAFDRILGQEPALQTLTSALQSGRVHHAYRFEGPEGVGKELAAFALAQSLLCTAGEKLGCGRCASCRRVVTFSTEEPCVPLHPDVVLVQRALYPANVLGTSTRETSGIGVEQIRRIVLARVGFAPHEGRALIYIVRDAHELTVQAANALLKTLEEPGPGVHFVLITSQPGRLLDTIRSRTLPIRFGRLSDADVEHILRDAGLPSRAVLLAEGSAHLALELADEEALSSHEEFVRGALSAVEATHPGEATHFAASKPADRRALSRQLSFLAQRIALEARERARTDAVGARRAATRYREVLGAIRHLEQNGQPALVLESMILRMRAS